MNSFFLADLKRFAAVSSAAFLISKKSIKKIIIFIKFLKYLIL
ncbi:hypothetical protein BSM4216_2252 [Bacillus smithii]|jgi:hypothetical protein|nr:hypothetical protein BSM4216_2252 [Bacillus smithii]